MFGHAHASIGKILPEFALIEPSGQAKTNAGQTKGALQTGAGAMVRPMKKTGLSLRADESPQTGVRRIADGLLDAALRRARRPTRNPVEDIHFFRTTTKRLRALLQLIRPVIAATTFNREIARLKRAAGRLAPFRDRAVAGKTLKALGKSVALLRRIGLAHFTKKAQEKGNPRNAMRQASRDLAQSRRAFERLRIGGKGWEVIGPGLMRTYRQARRRMKAAVADPSDNAFHRWRVRVKQLYYQLEWLEAVLPKHFGRMRKRLHELEEKLGTDHDLVVLLELLRNMPGTSDAAGDLDQVRKSAMKRSRRLRRASERLGAKSLLKN